MKPAMKQAGTPMFLPEVENNPQAGSRGDNIRTMQAAGREYPLIWHLFAYHPEAGEHLSRLTQEIMRGDCVLTAGFRELIAAYTSWGNRCSFCSKYHVAVAAEMLGVSQEYVWKAVRDLEESPLPEKEKALLRFVDRVNHHAQEVGPEDIAPLREVGWTDEAIYYAITVCALFNFYNRWVGASGVHPMSEEAHRESGARTASSGYISKPVRT
ncbi:MAG TPA: peroxidase-related enzyme [Terriglobia bacterium]|nr:peroxidase-related enzyme [Terriglobia bacterium]